MAVKRTMYQREVDVDMLNAIKSKPTHSLRRSAYPHQPYVDTLYIFQKVCLHILQLMLGFRFAQSLINA